MAEVTIRISDRVLKAGVALGGAICVAGLLYYLWSTDFFEPKYHLRMYVTEAANLLDGAPVQVDGIEVGRVQSRKLAGQAATPLRRIELTLRVERRDQEMIRADSTASLTSDGIFGKRYVNIERGFKGAPLKEGDEIPLTSSVPKTVQGFFSSISRMADCMKEQNAQPSEQAHPESAR